MSTPREAFLAAALFCSALSSACVTTSSDASGAKAAASPALASPWPSEFQSPAVLVADEVHIEGPPGLVGHVALRIDPGYQDRTEETTPDGYLQTVRTRPGSPIEIRCYLDRLEIAALARLTVLERPGDCDVIVRARGEVYYAHTRTGEEQRVSALQLVGRRTTLATGGG